MQYQHLVFEEFARTLVPQRRRVLGAQRLRRHRSIRRSSPSSRHAVFRLGHSMLTGDDRSVFDFQVVPDPATATTAPDQQLGLITAFLNPLEFAASGPTAGAGDRRHRARLDPRRSGNEIDEFVTDAVRNNLLGTATRPGGPQHRARPRHRPSALNAARRALLPT